MEIRQLLANELPPMELLLDADPSLSHIQEYLQRGTCFIAERNEQVFGVYVLLPTRPRTIELVNIAIKEEFQGQGLGKGLVLHAIQTAKDKGFKTIEVGTGNSSINQLALYQKCGFRIVGVDKDYFTRLYSDDIFENGIQCIDMIRLSQDL